MILAASPLLLSSRPCLGMDDGDAACRNQHFDLAYTAGRHGIQSLRRQRLLDVPNRVAKGNSDAAIRTRIGQDGRQAPRPLQGTKEYTRRIGRGRNTGFASEWPRTGGDPFTSLRIGLAMVTECQCRAKVNSRALAEAMAGRGWPARRILRQHLSAA